MQLKIDPSTYYDEFHLRIMGLDGKVLEEARKSGELRARQVRGGVVYKGEWLIAWLDGQVQEEVSAT